MNRRHRVVATSAALLSVAAMLALLLSSVNPAGAGVLGGPTISGVTPNVLYPGVPNQVLKIAGSFNDSVSKVEFTVPTGITIKSFTASASEVDATVDVAENAPNTARDVTVTQDGLVDGGSATCTKCVRVGPDINSAGPAVANTGTSATFNVTGHAFKAGASVKLERKSYGFGATESDSINATSVTIMAAGTPQNGEVSTLSASFNPLGRAPGRWKVTVINPDGASASFGDGITTGLEVTGSKPTLATITPSRINSNETSKQFTLTGNGFARGLTATVSGTGITQSAVIDYRSATEVVLRLTATAAPGNGPRTLILRNADDQSSTNSDAICANCDLPVAGPPTINTVTPAVLGQGASQVQMIVTGTNFGTPVPLVTVSPNGSGTAKIDVGVTRDSATQLTLTVSVGTTAVTGAHSLTVTNPNGGAFVTKDPAFTINNQFAVTNLTPPGRPKGFTGSIVINGSGFTGTPTVAINPGTGITLGTVQVDSPARLTVAITVAADAATAPRDVTVTQTGSPGSPAVCAGCFTVGELPTLSSISPTSGNGGNQVSISSVNGTNFKNPTVTLERSGQPNITLTQATTSGDGMHITGGTFDLTDAAPGKWTVRVTNEDGGTKTLPDAFTVVLPTPTITDVQPDTVSQATTSATLHLIGTAFAPGMVITFPNAGGISVTDLNRTSTTTADVKIATSNNATLGSRDVTITNTDNKSGTCTSCFTVIQGQQSKNFGPGLTTYENFNGGAYVASGSLDGAPSNGSEFVLGANAGGGPHVRPFRINPANGQIQELGQGFFAYGSSFPGGVRVAVGNLDGNLANGDEIVTAAGPGGGPHVKIFHLNNDLTVNEPYGSGFFAYGDTFSGGVWVATADVNGDGKDEIITGAGPGGGPHVKIWSLGNDNRFHEAGGWFAYPGAFTGGVAVAGGNVIPEDGAAQRQEIVTVPVSGGGPHVKVFDALGALKSEFFAFTTSDDNGYRVTAGDFNFDSVDDIAVGRGSSGEIYVAQVTASGPVALIQPNPAPFGTLPIGTNLAAVDADNDGDDDLVIVPDHASPVTIRLVRPLSTS